MSCFMARAAAPATYAAQSAPDVTIPFEPNGIIVVNESATNDCFVSFDGVNDHAHLLPMAAATVTGAVAKFRGLYTKVWLKQGGGAATVQVRAERA